MLIVAAGAAFGVALVCLSLDKSLSHFLIEDMFYYLTAARNLIAGKGASLDGIHPTNGFHPLWLMIVAGITLLTRDSPGPTVHLTLGLALLFHWITVGLLVAGVARLLGSTVAVAVAAVLVFNYRLVSIPLGGLETAVAGALVMLVTLFYAFGKPLETMRGAISFGLLLGLTFLARFDAVLFGAVLLAAAVLDGTGSARLTRRLALTTAAGAVALAICIPWFVFSLNATGKLLPTSGEAIGVWSSNPWRTNSSPTHAAKTLLYVLAPAANDVCNALGLSPWVRPEGRASFVAVGVLGALASALMAAAVAHRGSPLVRRLAWVPVYAGLHVAYYVHFGHALFRYLYPVLFPVLLFAAVVAAASLREGTRARLPPRQALLALPLLLASISAAAGWRAYRLQLAGSEFHGLHAALYDTAAWIARETPSDAVVGSFNAGIISYFSQRPTVNLDGVMNHSAIAALREKRLAEYVRANHITHLADAESQLDRFMGGFSGEAGWRRSYREVYRRDGTYWGGERRERVLVLEWRPEGP